MDFLSNPILLALSGVVGLLIGLLLSNLFSENKKSDSYELPKDLKKQGFTEVGRFWYSPAGRKILAGMDGGVYQEVGELTPEQHKRMNRLSQLIHEWANPQPKEVVEQPVVPSPQVDTHEIPAITPAEETPDPTNEVVPAAGDYHYTAIPEDILRRDLVENSTEEIPQAVSLPTEEEIGYPLEELRMKSAPANELEIPMEANKKQLTIVEQIDEILQKLVIGTSLEKRGLFLQDDLHNGVLVYVGSEKFDGVEAVPYPEAQSLIREAVAQWEQNLTAKNVQPE